MNAWPLLQTADAQDAFSSTSLRVGGVGNVNRSSIHEYWEPGIGGELSVNTPFYFGVAAAGAALHRYEASGTDVPRFDALLTYVGWGLELFPVDVVSWYNGLRVGIYRMTFDEETFAGIRNESELTLGLHTRIDLHLSSVVSLYAAGQYMRIYTAPRFDLTYVAGGIAVTLDSPRWLQTFLQ